MRSITIRHEVTYPHPREHVWVAITDPFALAEWFEPNDHQPVVGHRFRFVVDDSVKECEVLEAEPPCRLAWSWQYVPNSDTGKPRQSGPMRINWTLAADGEGTKLILEHLNAQNVRWFHRTLMRIGWKYMMKKFIPRVLRNIENGRFTPGAIPLAKRLYKCKSVPEQYVR
jgi:uncharacterized protein YndB with AHSA1/START domain